MQLLAINGSPHREGNTATLINELMRGAIENNHNGEIVHLVDLHLDYCNWCGKCWTETPGICPINDGFMIHLEKVMKADIIIAATPSSTRSVTGYMKNWLDRLCNSQLDYQVSYKKQVTMKSLVPNGKRAVLIVQGCTDLFQETIEPMNVVMAALEIPVIERIIVKKVGLTYDDTVEKIPDIMEQVYKIGKLL
jgi:multimeric flavodoxin WrbA